MAEMEQVRVAPAAKEGAELAPQEFARAEEQRSLARKAQADGDETAATLYADRAVAAYDRSLVLARLARAQKELAAATSERDQANAQLSTIVASQAQMASDAESLQTQVSVARAALLPAPSGPADPQREAARRVAARALAVQARLLCASAQLVSPQLAGLADQQHALDDLAKKLDATGAPAPIDDAARARAACLRLLTVARRSVPLGDGGVALSDADALLTELSATGGWDPSRDERGVVVALRGSFGAGDTLTPEAKALLDKLGKVAAAHPTFAVQVVVHDASAPSPADAATDRARADAIVKALVAAGANPATTKGETAGADAPIVDPADAANRPRNARVEIVFVAPTDG
jgi:outer membrane protein OmpA-like peptidoglycan-associated protein